MEKMIYFDNDLCLVDNSDTKAKSLAKLISERQIFYMYPKARKIIKNFLWPRVEHADEDANNRGLIYFLYGDYHTGKSHLIRYFITLVQAQYPHYWEMYEKPIITIDLENGINTANQLLLFLLDKLGRPVDKKLLNDWKKMSVLRQRLQNRLISLLERYGTRMLVLDECQKLLIARNPDILDIFELLKDLSTKSNWNGALRTQIVMCGTKDGLPLLEAADWIQGRTRTMHLDELKRLEFGSLLMQIYRDCVELGISEEWNLVNQFKETQKGKLNQDLALYVFSITKGKVGLTVDFIRNAVLLALDDGRLFPKKSDYESINFTEKKFIASKDEIPQNAKKHQIPSIHVNLHDTLCKIKGCPRSKKAYLRYSALIRHYKMKHPEIKIIYGDSE